MLCWLRSIGVCAGVLAICVMLASLSWQLVLYGIALASLAWAVFSLSKQLRPRRQEPKMTTPVSFNVSRRRPRSSSRVYSFPSELGNQSAAP
jgi:type IV secretory pathway TrbD component